MSNKYSVYMLCSSDKNATCYSSMSLNDLRSACNINTWLAFTDTAVEESPDTLVVTTKGCINLGHTVPADCDKYLIGVFIKDNENAVKTMSNMLTVKKYIPLGIDIIFKINLA